MCSHKFCDQNLNGFVISVVHAPATLPHPHTSADSAPSAIPYVRLGDKGPPKSLFN